MGRPLRDLTPSVSTQHRFGAELRRFRKTRGLSQEDLGVRVMHSGSTVSKVERAERWPSRDFVSRSDEVLRADGALTALWLRAEKERNALALDNAQAERACSLRQLREASLLDEILRAPGVDRGRLSEVRRLADRITTDLADLRAIVPEHDEGTCLYKRLEQAIDLLIAHAGPQTQAPLLLTHSRLDRDAVREGVGDFLWGFPSGPRDISCTGQRGDQ
ncbi:hypothetical protein DDE74_22185 [Streptomyces lydicus]|uniref:HTH cro/C1-type domain-containing protein n=1 Tax=Streptomyces lydicus TaxID=47763 RepID=A0A3Q9K397_9ACTN|nr:helix-turn-helix transcriptional regulator [Streptomyces lydicus]AZS73295.1 hypothetical protein DDE74_22185 [Streptomyces lydicus]